VEKLMLLTYTAESSEYSPVTTSHVCDQRSTRSNIEDDDDDKDVSWAIDSTPDGLDRRDTRFRVESDHQDHPPTWTRRQVRQAVGKGLMKR
jgi:3-phenylpropionate/cinnamic acid dioxygenase small subunit